MAQLIVRGLEDEVKRRLKERAVRHGQSMEAEVRDILCDALKVDGAPPEGLGTRIARRFARIGLKPGEELERPDWQELRNPFET